MNAYKQSEKVRLRLESTQNLLIDGYWRAASGNEVSDVYNPSTGRVIARSASASLADVDCAVTAARSAFDDGRWTRLSPSERGKILWRVADLMEQHCSELAELEMLDAGKFFQSAQQGEVPFAADCFRYYAGWCTKLDGSSKTISAGSSDDFHVYTKREAVGVAALIVPWNGPLVQAAWKLAPALAAGCSCVIKPAEETPLSTIRLAELMLEAGVPNGVVNVVLGDGERVGHHLAAHADVDKVSFTGSTEVGKKIVDAAKGNLKKVTLELGGKSPMIVFADADLESAADGVIEGIFSNAGQVCVASSRLYVHTSVYPLLLDAVKKRVEALSVGSALDPGNNMGPLISRKQLDAVKQKIDVGCQQGARLVCGGEVIENDAGYFMQPTVFADVSHDMAIVRDEIFGPVLTVLSFDDVDKIDQVANDSVYGLAASIWTKDVSVAHKMAGKIKAGLVWVNCHGIPDMAVPFGGYKQSGWGRENGYDALLQYTEQKSVVVKL